MVLSCLFYSNSLASDFERVTIAVYLPMLFGNCSLTCLVSAPLGALVLPLLYIYRILAADFEQVIFVVWTDNYINPALVLPCLCKSGYSLLLWTSHSFGPFVFCIYFPWLSIEFFSFRRIWGIGLYRLLNTKCNSYWLWASHCFRTFVSASFFYKFRACFYVFVHVFGKQFLDSYFGWDSLDDSRYTNIVAYQQNCRWSILLIAQIMFWR